MSQKLKISKDDVVRATDVLDMLLFIDHFDVIQPRIDIRKQTAIGPQGRVTARIDCDIDTFEVELAAQLFHKFRILNHALPARKGDAAPGPLVELLIFQSLLYQLVYGIALRSHDFAAFVGTPVQTGSAGDTRTLARMRTAVAPDGHGILWTGLGT